MYPIDIRDLSWQYGNEKILKDLNIKIHKSKFYSIIGPNGSGKTTLIKNISKTLESGIDTIFIDGKDVTKINNKELAQKISVVPQNTEIEFDFSVMDIVLMGRTPYLKKFQNETVDDVNIAKKAMELTNTLKLREKKINQISGGERQRVIIARALTQQTDIVLLDEPISHLDINHQIESLNTLKYLSNKGTTIITVMHDLNLAAQYSNYLILLKDGKLIALGKPEEVITKENLEKVYNMEICIIKNPVTQKPHVIPVSDQYNNL